MAKAGLGEISKLRQMAWQMDFQLIVIIIYYHTVQNILFKSLLYEMRGELMMMMFTCNVVLGSTSLVDLWWGTCWSQWTRGWRVRTTQSSLTALWGTPWTTQQRWGVNPKPPANQTSLRQNHPPYCQWARVFIIITEILQAHRELGLCNAVYSDMSWYESLLTVLCITGKCMRSCLWMKACMPIGSQIGPVT